MPPISLGEWNVSGVLKKELPETAPVDERLDELERTQYGNQLAVVAVMERKVQIRLRPDLKAESFPDDIGMRERRVGAFPHGNQHQHALWLHHENTEFYEPGEFLVFEMISQVPELDGFEGPYRVIQIRPDMAGRTASVPFLAKPLEEIEHIELPHP
jgi:hypothetical protein